MNQIGLFKNENQSLPERPIQSENWLKGLTSRSYWITNYIPNANSVVEVKFYKDTAVSDWAGVFGCRYLNTLSGCFHVYINRNNQYLAYSYERTWNDTATSYTQGTTYTVKLGNNQYIVNGQLIVQTYQSYQPLSYPLYLGALDQQNYLADSALQGKIYYMKIWENDTLVRNYLPQSDLTFKCTVTNHVASLVGSAEYGTDN